MDNLVGLAILAIFPLCMIFATFYDIFTMTIPNKISLILIGAFLILAPLAGVEWQTILIHFGVAFAVLVLGYMLFLGGQMGAGDAKLLAASALWFGTASLVPYLLWASIFGGILTLLIWLGRRFKLPVEMFNLPWLTRIFDKSVGIPYGAALGPAALFIFVDSQWMKFISTGVPIG